MSSLIFYTDDSIAQVATDTLAVDVAGNARQFTSKALFLPHLKTIIAGTGVAGFSTRWAAHVNDQMCVRGLEHLDCHAPGSLHSLYADIREEIGFPSEVTSTIYHIGVSEESGLIHAYAYRSENDFDSERLGHGLRMKPKGIPPEDYELPTGFVQIMESQRDIQNALPADKRIYIGGEIHYIELRPSGAAISHCIHKFSDFDETESAMYFNFGQP